MQVKCSKCKNTFDDSQVAVLPSGDRVCWECSCVQENARAPIARGNAEGSPELGKSSDNESMLTILRAQYDLLKGTRYELAIIRRWVVFLGVLVVIGLILNSCAALRGRPEPLSSMTDNRQPVIGTGSSND